MMFTQIEAVYKCAPPCMSLDFKKFRLDAFFFPSLQHPECAKYFQAEALNISSSQMLKRDVRIFFAIYSIFLFGFAHAAHVSRGEHNEGGTGFLGSLQGCFKAVLQEVSSPVQATVFVSTFAVKIPCERGSPSACMHISYERRLTHRYRCVNKISDALTTGRMAGARALGRSRYR